MAQKSRELSQFGSFLEVDNSNQNIGIATTATPYVGIGTINPISKFHVVGNTNVSGFVSATGYYLNGSPLVSAATESWSTSGSDIYRSSGNVGIGSTIPTQKLVVSGNISATGAFAGSGVTVTGSIIGNNITVTDGIIGSGVTVTGISTASQYTSTVSTGTAPFTVSSQTLVTNLNADYLRGKTPPSGDIVGNTDTQILTSKTINLSNNTLSGTLSEFNSALSGADFATLSGSETLTNKTLTSPIISSISNSGTQTIPTGTGTLVSSNSVGVVTTGMISDGTIVNADISASASIAVSKLSASTISGTTLGNNLPSLTFGTYLTGTSYNGTSAVTLATNATSSNTASTLVARNASGDFTAGTVTASVFNATTTDAFRISGTTVINSSRNLINVVNANFSGIVSDSYGNLRDIPQNSQTSSYSLQITDAGRHISITTGGVTVPSSVFSTGDAITIFNDSSSNQTITQGSGVTLRFSGTTLTGNRTLLPYGVATVLCVNSNVFAIVGIVT